MTVAAKRKMLVIDTRILMFDDETDLCEFCEYKKLGPEGMDGCGVIGGFGGLCMRAKGILYTHIFACTSILTYTRIR